jgi:RNA polymerase sigma factor (TIGR02999 family)
VWSGERIHSPNPDITRQNIPMQATGSLTDLIRLARDGDAAALHRIFDLTYPDLRRLARMRLTQNARGVLLDTTALVHESYLRFVNAGELNVNDRHHFMRYAANVMRSVIVDFVRERLAERRGGGAEHVTLDTYIGDTGAAGEGEILRVHEALEELAQYDERMTRVVEMRYFAGMTEPEIAEALGVTDRTVRRDWEKARLLLAKALSP